MSQIINIADLKESARRVVEEIWNEGNLALVDELKADDHRYYSSVYPDVIKGREGYKSVVTTYRTAFPDLRLTIDDMVLEENKGAFRWTIRGTHQGELFGIPATGKAVTFAGVTIGIVENGKGVEEWVLYDNLGLMEQLGVVSLPR